MRLAFRQTHLYRFVNMEVTPRFELGNEGFADPCLTTWLCHRMEKGANALLLFFFWSGRRGSNSLPPPWQGGALPDELRPRNIENNSRYMLVCQAVIFIFHWFWHPFFLWKSALFRQKGASHEDAPFYRIVVVKKSRHEKYLFLIYFFKSGHDDSKPCNVLVCKG